MENRSKKLITVLLICLVLLLLSFLPQQELGVAAGTPTISIINVSSTSSSEIEATVEISLPGANHNYYIRLARLYLNQSADVILANDYKTVNGSVSFALNEDETIEAEILSSRLDEAPFENSAYYNITVVAITNTGVKSELVHWAGGYYYIDNDEPEITLISPSEYREEVWGFYNIEAEVTDISNLSYVEILVDNTVRYREENPDSNQHLFNWTWQCFNHTRGTHFIWVKAADNTPRSNLAEETETVRVVGPEMEWVGDRPTYVDCNATLNLTVIVDDLMYDMQAVKFHFSLNDGPWTSKSFIGPINFEYNFSLPQQPLGTKITWEIFANNTEGQYHKFRDENLEPFVIYSVYPDHIPPTGEVNYKKQVSIEELIHLSINITEQSPISKCLLNYQINFEDWQEEEMTNSSAYEFSYTFNQTFPVYAVIRFSIRVNDSGGNVLLMDNEGSYYSIKVFPIDRTPPNITISSIPDEIINGRNITITVTIEDNSTITAVYVMYSFANKLHMVEMEQTSETTWSATFTPEASTGQTIELWVRALDEFYNTADSEVTSFEIKSAKIGVRHANIWLVLLLLLVIVIPVVITIYMLKPQR